MSVSKSEHRHRSPRIPLFLPATTRPALARCWTLNLSLSGLALTAESNGAAPREGMGIEVAFTLPDATARVQLAGTVVWVDVLGEGPGRRVAFGIAFRSLRPNDRAALARYLADSRPHVLLAQPAPEEHALAEQTLGPDVAIHVAQSEEELRRLLGRGDVRAVVVFGEDEGRAMRAVDAVAGRAEGGPLEPTPRIVCCARISADRLLRLVSEGKVDQSLQRPVDPHWLRLAVRRACEDYLVRAELKRVSLELKRAFRRVAPPPAKGAPVTDLIVESPAMRAVLDLVCTVAPHKAHVLLQGETGAGKELLARSIHELSTRSGGPFIAIDCGALPETLLESELFGHVQGAFTGATVDRPGLFQLAEGGTLFLDEIENTSPQLQAKLLRAIDAGEVRPVGGSRPHRVDVRLVAASNRDLRLEVEAGRFRADLYYRLSAFPIDVPPLRQRPEDVLPLAEHFVRRIAEAMGRAPSSLSQEAQQALLAYGWPGNARELRNVLERALLLTPPGAPISSAVLPEAVRRAAPASTLGASLRDQVRAAERDIIRAALERNGGVVRRAARELRTSIATLARKVHEHGLRG